MQLSGFKRGLVDQYQEYKGCSAHPGLHKVDSDKLAEAMPSFAVLDREPQLKHAQYSGATNDMYSHCGGLVLTTQLWFMIHAKHAKPAACASLLAISSRDAALAFSNCSKTITSSSSPAA